MLKILIFIFAILITTKSSAQLQADFHCTGSGFDAGCGGFADISNPFASIIVNLNGFSSQKCKQNYMSRDSIGVHCNYFIGIPGIERNSFDFYPNPVKENITFSMNDF